MSVIERIGGLLSPIIRIETIKTTVEIAEERRQLRFALQRAQLELLNNIPIPNDRHDYARCANFDDDWVPKYREAFSGIFITGDPDSLHPEKRLTILNKWQFPFMIQGNRALPVFEHLQNLPQAS